MTTQGAQPPDESAPRPLRLLEETLPPLHLTVLLGTLTSIQLSSGIAADAARELLAVGRRALVRERRPRV